MERQYNQKEKGKMVVVNSYISIINLKVSVLNSPIERYRGGGWVKKRPY